MADNTELLANVFQAVTKTLVENQQTLDQADDMNHDHGTNMVKTFQTITRSVEKKKNSSSSNALAYAAQQLSKKTISGSGKLYAQGLATAADQFKGQTVDTKGAIQLLQTLLGGGQSAQQQTAQSTGGDMLGALLGGLTGGGQPVQQQATQSSRGDLLGTLLGGLTGADQSQPQQQVAQPAGGDLLGSLLGGLTGAGQSQPQQQNTQQAGGDLLGSLLGGLTGTGNSQANKNTGAADNSRLDMGDLLNAGMAFMQAKQSGSGTAAALLQAVLSGSGMGSANHRQQSTQLVASSFLQALGALSGSK